ncbi:hypothetical protein SAMN04487907_102385 [Zunongwangia mangrovi]|uniref:Uncharacterized protein n=1 Tax=Zunongwangia mangrovi TaxID=1334022 RepID=A0A1I1GSI4_9FLAO|nr:hypothetical protein [Zunongwangia mangrovi]SFC14262.1 hypothetical protein SAMN04487907_102385 [Zunongwangia mangrovi]
MLKTRHFIGLLVLGIGFLIKMLFTHLVEYYALVKGISLFFIFVGLAVLLVGVIIRSEEVDKGSFKKDPITYILVSLMQIILVIGITGFAIVLEHFAEGANHQLAKVIIQNSYNETIAVVSEERRVTKVFTTNGYEDFAIFNYQNNFGTLEQQGKKVDGYSREKLLRKSINYDGKRMIPRLDGQQFKIRYSTRFPSMFIVVK